MIRERVKRAHCVISVHAGSDRNTSDPYCPVDVRPNGNQGLRSESFPRETRLIFLVGLVELPPRGGPPLRVAGPHSSQKEMSAATAE